MNENTDNIENEVEVITRTFVLTLLLIQQEDVIINNTLDQIQSNNPSLIWPEINGIPINKFQTPKYITRAFSVLYPYSQANFCSICAKDMKLAEYFKHLLV